MQAGELILWYPSSENIEAYIGLYPLSPAGPNEWASQWMRNMPSAVCPFLAGAPPQERTRIAEL